MLTERARISGYALTCCMGEKIRRIQPDKPGIRRLEKHVRKRMEGENDE